MAGAANEEKITVVIVDDHTIVRQGLRTYLELQPDILVVGEAANGSEAMALVRDTLPDIVLMDLVMLLLSKAGMHTITFDDLYAALTQGHELPSHPVLLTFDDGYEDFYTAAFPVLQALQMKATSFIITGKAGWKGYMTWDQMREIDRSGLVEFESHTVNHVELSKISPSKAEQEMIDSKHMLETELGKPVKYLAYPSGRFNSTVANLAQAVGYEAAVTTQYGSLQSSSGLLTLPRVRIPGAESLWSFALSVWTKN